MFFSSSCPYVIQNNKIAVLIGLGILYNNVRLFTCKEYHRHKLITPKILAHGIDTITYPLAGVYAFYDLVTLEGKVRGIRNEFAYPSERISAGLLTVAGFE